MVRIYVYFPTTDIDREYIINAAEVSKPPKDDIVAIHQEIVSMYRKYGAVVLYEDVATGDVYVAGYRSIKDLIKDIAYNGGVSAPQESMEVYVDNEADAKMMEFLSSIHVRTQWIRV